MLTYDAKFYLKNSVTREDCIQVFTEWVREGKSNHCNDLKLPEDYGDFKYKNDKIEFLIKTFDDGVTSLTACRLINLDTVGVFTVSIIFIQGQNGESSTLLVQQDFETLTEEVTPSKYNRPYIVKLIFDNGWIDSSKYLSFGGKPYGEGKYYFNLTEDDVETTAAYLGGRADYDLPIVYISYDYPKRKYHLSEPRISNIAKNLLGTAYVLVEPTKVSIIDNISIKSKAKVYKGYVGIYFPNKNEYIYLRCNKNIEQTLNKIIWTLSVQEKSKEVLTWEVLLDFCKCYDWLNNLNKEIAIKNKELEKKQACCNFYEYLGKNKNRVISYSVFDIEETEIEDCRNLIIQTLNHISKTQYASDSRPYNLLDELCKANKETNFLALQSTRKKGGGNPLNIYTVNDSFLEEAQRVEDKLNELKNQLQAVESKLSKYIYNEEFNLIVIPEGIEEFFEDEINDIIMLCMEKAKRIDSTISENKHYKKIVAGNSVKGNGIQTFESIKNILSKSEWDNNMQTQLEELGFTINSNKSKHVKAYYKDKQYSVTISCTPSEHRGGKNTAAELISKISIYNSL